MTYSHRLMAGYVVRDLVKKAGLEA